MRKALSIGIIILLLLAIPVHLWSAFMLFFWTYSPENPLLWALLLASIAPPVILFRRWVDKPWSYWDMILAGIIVLPGVAVGTVTILSGSSIGALLILEMLLCSGFVAGCIYLWRHPERASDRMVSLDQRPATGQEFVSSYEQIFAERGDVTPPDPLEFHLYHLARYWSRLVGFCRHTPGPPEFWADGSMGIAIRVANRFTDPLVESATPHAASWSAYKQLAGNVLHRRRVLLDEVEAASEAFDRFLAEVGFDPWSGSPSRQAHPIRPEDLLDKNARDAAV